MNLKKTFSALLIGASVLSAAGCAGTRTQESTGQYIDDAAITAKVKTALAKDPDTKALQIQVETFRGEVQLSGFVDSAAAASKAVADAQNVNGVRGVKNSLQVKGH